MSIEYKDNSEQIRAEFYARIIRWLHEACGELTSQTQRNQRVRTGRTKGSWRYVINETKLEGYVASDSENAIYEEFGTGEYALNGNGRKGGWWYKDEFGKWHFTKGKKPCRALYNAYSMLKNKIIEQAKTALGGMG